MTKNKLILIGTKNKCKRKESTQKVIISYKQERINKKEQASYIRATKNVQERL